MDATNAQTSFVEIAFAINTSFTLYAKFRDRFDLNVDEFQAFAYTIEAKHGEVRRLNAIRAAVDRYANQHSRIQEACVRIATFLSLLAAIICVVLLYFDVLGDLGHWAGLLILPFPTFFLVSACNYGVFRARGAWMLRRT